MTKKTSAHIAGIFIVLSILSAVFYSCSSPQNPFNNPDNVTINLIVPDTVNHAIYTGDTTHVAIVINLPLLADSVKLSIAVIKDTVFPQVMDTIPVDLIFKDTGSITILATVYCDKGISKFCQKIMYVHKNPLMPPDTVYTKTLSSSAILLYWKKVSVAKQYMVYRSLSDTGTFSLIKTLTDTLYPDSALSAATTYYYRLSSTDSLNRESDLSSIYMATTASIPLSRWDEMVWDSDKWEQ